ncbi:NUDIX hydrolase [Rouxiella badensis]|uniref:NUDIX hydrolase n=1 Tax=Rouxiella badensis TaxID=1646377 RepID=UPI001D15D7D1|nr:NUDIX hydrolase [Rouxiella badensis]MCC3705556.1 NUDIX hydrolase [Rouxiella badensis]
MKIVLGRLILVGVVFLALIIISFHVLNLDTFLGWFLALVAAVLLWLFTGEDKIGFILYLTSRGRLRKDIKVFFKSHQGNSLSNLEGKLKKRLRSFFNKKELDVGFINSATSEECVALMLAMQNQRFPFDYSNNLALSDFKNIARNASKNIFYRDILLAGSLDGINYKNHEEIGKINDNKYDIGNELKEQSDRSFINRLMAADKDEVILFSTTSQISSDIIKIITNHHEKISKVSFFICSPFIIKDSAIESMFSEYNNPSFATPVMQFIQNGDGSINTQLDAVRRVLKITSSITNLVNISSDKGIEIEINLFKRKYPGLKVKLLKKSKFLQIQPGNLTYANNLYRFGVESDSSKLISDVYNSIVKYRNSAELVEQLSLTTSGITEFQNKVLSELTLWLLEHGVTHEDIKANKKELIRTVDDIEASKWLDSIERVICVTRENIQVNLELNQVDLDDILKVRVGNQKGNSIFVGETSNGIPFHITVAMLFIYDGKILVIKKSDPAYDHKYSVVAGHLENGESPRSALLREVKEELGMTLIDFKFLSKEIGVKDLCRYGLNLHDWYIFYSDGYIDIDSIEFDSSEIESVEWISLHELNNIRDKFTQGSSLILKKLGYVNE